MGRKRAFEIKENLAELKSYIPKVRGYKPSKRLESLILIKSDQYKKLEEVAAHLGVTRKTLLNWIKEYKQGGIALLLSPAKRNKPSKLITPEIHEELEKRLLSKKNPFSSYVEVKEWLLKQYGVEIEYQWLWKYMRTKFKSILKIPRKTNVKKNPDKDFDIPPNIALINIPPYSPELNPCEQVWQYIKKRFKNKTFENMELLREWLYETLNAMDNQKVKSITSNHHYLKIFTSIFMV